MSGGSSSQGKTVSGSEPWGPAQGKLKNVLGQASSLYKNDVGFNPYEGNWYTGPSANSQAAMDQMAALGGQKNPLSGAQTKLAQNLIGGRYTPDSSRYEDLYGQAGDNALMGTAGIDSLLGRTDNTAFNAALDNQAGKLGDDITRQFGGAAFGSPAHSGTIADQVGQMRTQAEANNFFQRAGLEQGLLGDRNNIQNNLVGQRMGIAGAINAGNQQGVQNQLAGNSIANGAYASQFLPAQYMAQAGNVQDQFNTAQLQGQMNQWNAGQSSPWDRLNAYSGLVGGASSGYGTTTGTASSPSSPWASAAGGALLGAQAMPMMPLLGAGVGALGGAFA